MKTILVPTDFSDNALNAINYAAAIASQVRGKLILAHIINLPVTPVSNGVVVFPDPKLEDDCKAELHKLSKELRLENGFRFEIEIVCQYGYFLANLNELVKTRAVDLVVMGTRGATNFLNKLIGTNTSEFIKIAACPVLAVPAKAQFTGFKQVAYASDFENSDTVFLQQLFNLTEPFKAAISIINILTERQLNIFCDNQIIRDITKQFPHETYSIAQIQEQDVIEGLRNFVQDNQIDVLAVALHERSFIQNIFHKSVSKKLCQHLELPLLALPEKPSRNLSPLLKAKAKVIPA